MNCEIIDDPMIHAGREEYCPTVWAMKKETKRLYLKSIERNKMKIIIIQLEFLRKYAKTIHYNYAGLDFLSIHKYMDKVEKPINGFVDEIKEKYFMYNKLMVPSFQEIDPNVLELLSITDGEYSVSELSEKCKAFVITIDQTINNPSLNLDNGDIDLLSRIASHFKTVVALLQGVQWIK